MVLNKDEIGELLQYAARSSFSNYDSHVIAKNILNNMQYGSKDLMRIEDIRAKSGGDFIEEVKISSQNG
jgi:hypothetical protein